MGNVACRPATIAAFTSCGRGWTAAGAFTLRRGTGEGVDASHNSMPLFWQGSFEKPQPIAVHNSFDIRFLVAAVAQQAGDLLDVGDGV